jgi:hypothetical protein
MKFIDNIIRIKAASREQLRSEFEKPSNPISESESCRRSAMSDEQTIQDDLAPLETAIRTMLNELS